MMKTVVACAAACVLFVAAGPVSADEGNNLIWAPSKTGENAYRLRLGAQYSGSVDVSGGSDFSVSATKAGRVQAPPSVGIWGLLSRQKKAGPAATSVAGCGRPVRGRTRFRQCPDEQQPPVESPAAILISRAAGRSPCNAMPMRHSVQRRGCPNRARVTAVATGTRARSPKFAG